MITNRDRILIVAAHPDDEVLGCGGTIRTITDKFVLGSAPPPVISALILSEGLTSRESDTVKFNKKDTDAVRQDSLDAAKILGIQNSYFEDLPNNRLDSMDLLDVIKIAEKYILELQPTIVFTHHYGDINIAHRMTYQAVLTACRPLQNCPVEKLLSFEIASSTEWNFPTHTNAFSPNVYVEIGDAVETKIQAMQAYRSERRTLPHPRSPEAIRAIALRWGSVANLGYTEAFELIYERNKLI
ncbi:PIG-L domain-containing protein [Synergistales bacterium]|nr:PIG-L domain-containing protein [Synergistales bacterium]